MDFRDQEVLGKVKLDSLYLICGEEAAVLQSDNGFLFLEEDIKSLLELNDGDTLDKYRWGIEKYLVKRGLMEWT